MPFIKPSCVEALRNRINIYDVVAPHVALTKAGSKWRGLSPFNSEKTPSFYIDPEKNFYYCFSSGQGGDIFRFIQVVENLNFNEAVETLARRFNLPIEYEHSGAQVSQTASLHKQIREIHEVASDFFQQVYHAEDTDAQTIRTYWTQERRFPPELAATFRIGLAPAADNRLLKTLLEKGYSPDALRKCGLFYPPQNTASDVRFLRPRFRGRLILPICDVQGRIIAFAGRQTELTPTDDPTHNAKYINSPETLLFAKNRVLFGLDRARQHVRDTGHFLLVEGPLDVLRCWQYGLKTAVAPQGTAITSEQLVCLRRYTDCIQCLLDGDAAGQKAALRLLPLALSDGLEVRFLPLPKGSDPDSFLAQSPPPAPAESEEETTNSDPLAAIRKQSLSGVAFALRALLPDQDAEADAPPPSPQEKARALAELYRIIDHAQSVVTRDEYRKEAAHLLDCNPESLAKDFHAHPQTHTWPLRSAPEEDPLTTVAPRRKAAPTPTREKQATENLPLTSAEYEFVCILLHYPDLGPAIANALDLDWIRKDTPYAALLKRLVAEFREELWEGPEHLDRLLETDAEKNLVYGLLSKDFSLEDPVKNANQVLKSLFKHHLREQKHSIQLLINASPPEAFSERQKLQQKIIALRRLEPPSLTLTSHGC